MGIDQPTDQRTTTPWLCRHPRLTVSIMVLASVALVHVVAVVLLFPVSDTACYSLPLLNLPE
jgi:hypothetical protein